MLRERSFHLGQYVEHPDCKSGVPPRTLQKFLNLLKWDELAVVNRSGSRPSHEGASAYLDQAVRLCRQTGFKKILLRGDTDFTQTRELDRWDTDGVEFIFGVDAMANLVDYVETLPKSAWKPLDRPAKYKVQTQERQRPENAKEQIVRQREFENVRLRSEGVAEFSYRPTACEKMYRLVVVRKNLSIEKGVQVLFDDLRYFFHISISAPCKGAGLQRVRIPPGNWVAPAGSSRSSGGGNEAVGAFDVRVA